MKISDLDFDSSYIITEYNLDYTLSDYQKIIHQNIKIYYDINLDVIKYTFNDKIIILIGYCFDTRNSSKTNKDILKKLITHRCYS